MRRHSRDATLALAAIGLCATFVPSFGSVLSDGSTPQMQAMHAPGQMLMRGGMGGGGMRGGGMGGGGMRGGGMGGGYRGGGGDFGGGSRDLRSSASSNVNFGGGNRSYQGGGNFSGNRNINNTNINVNNNVNRNYNGNIHGECYGGCNGGWGNRWDHPVAAAAVVGATAAVTAAAIGSVAYSLPPDCGTMYNGYYQCGETWYQPQYEGTDVQYVVVNPPQ
jgi:hypothetical protein